MRTTGILCCVVLLICAIQLSTRNTCALPRQGSVKYMLDARRSKFIAHGQRGGLAWFEGHEHLIAVKDYSGEADITSGTILPASLHVVAKSDSLEETSSVFTPQQKQIINKELREIVFQPEQFPEIRFESTEITGTKTTGDQFEAKIKGNLTLHGVTHPITIPAKVTVSGDTLHAVGEFHINRDDFKVKATSAFHGLVQVRNSVKIEFDMMAQRM